MHSLSHSSDRPGSWVLFSVSLRLQSRRCPDGDLIWGSGCSPKVPQFWVEFNSFVVVALRPSVSRGHSHKSLKNCELPYRDRKHISDSPGKKKLDYKGARKHFEHRGFVHYLGCGDGFTGVYKCWDSSNRILHIGAVYCMSIISVM